ncbi:MAG TPA: hypothetical protein VGL81_20160 [Polyangiaceae bacterium]
MILVAHVMDDDARLVELAARGAQRGQDLFVDAPGPEVRGRAGEQADVLGRERGLPVGGEADARHEVGQRLVRQRAEQLGKPADILCVETIVGVHPEDPVARGPAERLVSGRGEVVTPRELEDARSE